MAYVTELEMRIVRKVWNTSGEAEDVAVTQRVKFEPYQVQFGVEADAVFTLEEALDGMRGIILERYESWSAPKPSSGQRQANVQKRVVRPPQPTPPEPEEREPEEEPQDPPKRRAFGLRKRG